jgi:hypothetical protein
MSGKNGAILEFIAAIARERAIAVKKWKIQQNLSFFTDCHATNLFNFLT